MGEYEAFQVCLNGHVINRVSIRFPQHNMDYCKTCGEKTIQTCQQCNEPIDSDYYLGEYEWDDVDIMTPKPGPLPNYCKHCGKPFPWTEAKLQAAKELAEELDLSDEEKEIVKASIDDLATDTPKTELAAYRFTKYVDRKSGGVGSLLYKIVLDFTSSTTAKLIQG